VSLGERDKVRRYAGMSHEGLEGTADRVLESGGGNTNAKPFLLGKAQGWGQSKKPDLLEGRTALAENVKPVQSIWQRKSRINAGE